MSDPDDKNGIRLGQFAYNGKGPPLQYFELDELPRPFHFVEVKIHSNQGNEYYTCVYRLVGFTDDHVIDITIFQIFAGFGFMAL